MSSRRPDPLAQVSDFDIRLLRIFRSVVECGGFSAAETVLGIGRSAISQALASARLTKIAHGARAEEKA